MLVIEIPMLLSHYKMLAWVGYQGAVQYPGVVIPTQSDADKYPQYASFHKTTYNADRRFTVFLLRAGRMWEKYDDCNAVGIFYEKKCGNFFNEATYRFYAEFGDLPYLHGSARSRSV